uniref:Uncharacterized protein n=1 Tax=Mucochytrium quahogii TaxID=96639 RepID=A0A7S2S8M9_9STRA|mmetsp:Transcript_26214/g.57211  ORF Transcript_26214/g.57211 Transcript_26214/m.57211 type:complete len:2424 (+) Transcript_26214:471-7742(+)
MGKGRSIKKKKAPGNAKLTKQGSFAKVPSPKAKLEDISGLNYEELLERKDRFSARLEKMGGAVQNIRVGKAQDVVEKTKAHWDYLLSEMNWMAKDFKTERKWKEQQQRKLAKSAVRAFEKFYDQDLATSKHMKRKAKQVCTIIAREVKSFWEKVDRIVTYKHKTEYQAKQQAAMDKHLNYLVGQTERYSNLLAKKLKDKADDDEESEEGEQGGEDKSSNGDDMMVNSMVDEASVLTSNVTADSENDEDYDESAADVADDERTIVPSCETQPDQVEDELNTLKEEAQMSKEELLELYGYKVNNNEKVPEEVSGGDDAVDENKMSSEDENDWSGEDEQDDETTMDQACETKPDDVEDELDTLKKEAEMSKEELMKLYGVPDTKEINREGEDDSEGDENDWSGEDEQDDETTMDQACETKPNAVEEELDTLKKEAEMSKEELMKLYGVPENGVVNVEEDPGSEEDENEWSGEDEQDDETTMDQACETKPDEVEDELDTLKKEAEMSREELMKLYGVPVEAKNEGEEICDDEKGDATKACKSKTAPLEDEADTLKQETSMSKHVSEPSEDEKDWSGEEEQDDETTLKEEDCETKPTEIQGELDTLKREAEMSKEELMKLYGVPVAGESSASCNEDEGDHNTNVNQQPKLGDTLRDESPDGSDSERDWDGEEEYDDEGTMDQTDETKPDEVEDELNTLKKEAEMSREELMKLYGVPAESDNEMEVDKSKQVDDDSQTSNDEEGDDGLLQEGGIEAVAAARELAAQDKAGEAQLKYEVPFLMSKDLTLREYQRAGLDWLVSMFERNLNGILADEMGLGKTVQTISLLAHLASDRGVWGPHLIIVPTSVLLNWEIEIKKFCPGFKILTYYGSAKERKLKRTGWTKPNAFHICITSYQLAVQDANVLKRKKWFYLILDEAHNIKNFRSQRWQTLLNFNTKRRLLLTGTPLQNSLMELWSLMHFLMPHVFRSQSEFKYWFSNPMNAVVEGKGKVTAAQAAAARQEQNRHYAAVIKRLHTVIRPFLLRRLKVDVAKQLPGKFEHIVKIELSRRQRFLYEDFISRGSTRKALTSGGYLGMMSILMKLRMVCNHPDIFEPRVIESPFSMEPLQLATAALSYRVCNRIGRPKPLAGLELEFGPDRGFASRELEEPRGYLESKSDVSRVVELVPEKGALVEVLSSIEFDPKSSKLSLSPMAVHELNAELARLRKVRQVEHEQRVARVTNRNTKSEMLRFSPVYGRDLRQIVTLGSVAGSYNAATEAQVTKCKGKFLEPVATILQGTVLTLKERTRQCMDLIEHFVFITPKAITSAPVVSYFGKVPGEVTLQESKCHSANVNRLVHAYHSPRPDKPLSGALLHPAANRLSVAFPDKMLVQYDCGKLQVLARMLRKLQAEGHRVLIFTQMTKMLDILEIFLNIHGYKYFRLDGSTKVDARQRMMEKFNRDPRIFTFILSTRSGGLGINLTGADTVIFYDSDWNPSMDAQAQDRAHRIGQTRDVHIYRLICEHTIEENILTKANQKRHLNKLSVEDGQFTVTSFLQSGGNIKDLLGVEAQKADMELEEISKAASQREIEEAMAAAEDDSDKIAAKRATEEAREDMNEFDESVPFRTTSPVNVDPDKPATPVNTGAATPMNVEGGKTKGDADSANGTADNTLLTADQFESLEKQLNAVERYAISFRTYWSPAINSIVAHLQLKELEEAQHRTWEMERLEQEREEMEDQDAEELIQAMDGEKFDVTQYNKARTKISEARRHKLLAGSAWEKGVCKTTGRHFYWSKDENETTWDKPLILTALAEQRTAKRIKWRKLPMNILIRLFRLAETPKERVVWGKVCKKWSEALKSKELFLWVDNATDLAQRIPVGVKTFKNDWMTIGTWVEALYLEGEVWYPAMICNVHGDGTYDVMYTDGYVEKGLRRSLLRIDSGYRYTFVRPEDPNLAPYGVFNKHHSSGLGCGVIPPQPRRFTSVSRALEVAQEGDVVVLRAGLHKVEASLEFNKGIKFIGEYALAKALGEIERVTLTISGEREPVPGNEHVFPKKMKRVNSKSSIVSQAPPSVLPPPPVEVIGIEARDKDFLEDRQREKELEEKSCTTDVQVRSPMANSKRMENKRRILWTYKQSTAVECCHSGASMLTVNTNREDIILEGVAFFHASPTPVAKPDDKSGVLVQGDSACWFRDCTITNLHGKGSCVTVDGVGVICAVTHSVLCSAPESGIRQICGSTFLLDSEVCSNGKSGVLVQSGVLFLKRAHIFGNAGSAVELGSEHVHVEIVGNDLRGNKDAITGRTSDNSHVLNENNLIEDEDEYFEEDPWELAHTQYDRRRAKKEEIAKKRAAELQKLRRAKKKRKMSESSAAESAGKQKRSPSNGGNSPIARKKRPLPSEIRTVDSKSFEPVKKGRPRRSPARTTEETSPSSETSSRRGSPRFQEGVTSRTRRSRK